MVTSPCAPPAGQVFVRRDEGEAVVRFMSCDLYGGVGTTWPQVLSAVRACAYVTGTGMASLGLDQDVA